MFKVFSTCLCVCVFCMKVNEDRDKRKNYKAKAKRVEERIKKCVGGQKHKWEVIVGKEGQKEWDKGDFRGTGIGLNTSNVYWQRCMEML